MWTFPCPFVSKRVQQGHAMGAFGEPDELGARVRAAIAYAHGGTNLIAITADILASIGINHSRSTVQRIRNGKWFAGQHQAVQRAVLVALGDRCGVPDYFMLEGWPQPEDRAELEQRIRELEQWLDEEGQQRPA